MTENSIIIKMACSIHLLDSPLFEEFLHPLQFQKLLVKTSVRQPKIQKYNLMTLNRTIKRILTSSDFFIELYGTDYVSIVRFRKDLIISLHTTYSRYIDNEEYFTGIINSSFDLGYSSVGYICSLSEFLLQKDIDLPNNYPNPFRHIQQINFNYITDSESFKENFYKDDVWHPAYWQMWFSIDNDYNILQKTFSNDIQIQIPTGNYIKIVLYKNFLDYAKEDCFKIRSAFRQTLYENDFMYPPTVSIQRQGNRLIISHYLDSQGQSVPRSCASYCEKLEYQLLSRQTAILISRKQFPYK